MVARRSSEKPTAHISLKLFHDASVPMRRDPCLGVLNIDLHALLTLCTSDAGYNFLSPIYWLSCSSFRAASLQLNAVEGALKGETSATIMLRMRPVAQLLAKDAIDEAQNAVGLESLASGLNVVVAKLDLILKIGNGASQVRANRLV